MGSVSDLSARRAHLLIQFAGGPDRAALTLGVGLDQVERWGAEGMPEEIAQVLRKQARARLPKRGRPARNVVMTFDEVAKAVERHGGFCRASRTLGIPVSSLRRYLDGTSTPSEVVSDRLAGERLADVVSPWRGLIERAGGRRRVAEALGVSWQTVRAWAIGLSAPAPGQVARLREIAAAGS